MDYFFKASAVKQLKKLPRDVQERILSKIDFFCRKGDPLKFAEPLVRSELGHYRFCIGDYRVIIDLDEEGIIVLLVGRRRDIYR